MRTMYKVKADLTIEQHATEGTTARFVYYHDSTGRVSKQRKASNRHAWFTSKDLAQDYVKRVAEIKIANLLQEIKKYEELIS